MKYLGITFAFPLLVLSACGAPQLFPPDVMNDVKSKEFGVLQARPDVFRGQAIQVAGRIIGVQTADGGTLIVAQQLPIREHPVYGPAETLAPTPEFAVLYPGKIDPNALWFGNKFVTVAIAQGTQTVTVEGATRTDPYMRARCMHVWKTGEYGSYEISDFPHTTDGYYPLEQDTYCIQ